MLDDQALRQYREQLRRLEAELAQHEDAGRQERAATARAERDRLLAQLLAATGHASRVRRFADDDERARIAVTKAIRRGIERVAAADPVIAAALRQRVQTGTYCGFSGG